MNSSGSTKRGVGVFLRVVIYPLKNTPTSHAVSLALLCMHAVILQCLFCHALAITVNGGCLHLLVPPPAQCYFFSASCLHNCMYCGGRTFEREKYPLQQLHSVGQIFEGGPIFKRLPYMYWYPLATELSPLISEPLGKTRKPRQMDTIYDRLAHVAVALLCRTCRSPHTVAAASLSNTCGTVCVCVLSIRTVQTMAASATSHGRVR